MTAQDILDRDAYERDPSLFWLWPERWLNTPINKASQKFEAFWQFIPRARDWIRVKVGAGSLGDVLWGATQDSFAGLQDRRETTDFGGWSRCGMIHITATQNWMQA